MNNHKYSRFTWQIYFFVALSDFMKVTVSNLTTPTS